MHNNTISPTAITPSMKELLKLSYSEYVSFLLQKYGTVKYDYFANEKCATVCRKNSKSNEGLCIHHICESIVPKLSSKQTALRFSFFFQRAENLVYCNDLEHLLLHIKIAELPCNEVLSLDFLSSRSPEASNLGGVYEYLIPRLNDIYGGYEGTKQDYVQSKKLLQHKFDDYILALKHFWEIVRINNSPSLSSYKIYLSKGYALGEVDRVRNAIFNDND